ncbi:SusD/RagB family nutrient-binding outer membrane lipoprotein [uncultured Rikenella sp.]|uniref:SusD/RagB family nutrient-binding outer membrane lipoprotein n=1 Tax=uncultured Rikenella sp. TaxID=368003 RepID=UPI00272D6F0B|nr:SusD/RagB family nutrient-binding outer membrane lipoprotein [uncultured Rikenella sp.]
MKITKYLIGGLAALALVGCKDKMRELNTNPNTITTTDPRYVFLSVMQDFDYSERGFGEQLMFNTAVKMQYFVSYTGATDGTYCDAQADTYVTPGTVSYTYDRFYDIGHQMVELQRYIDALPEHEKVQYTDLHAIAGIVKVYEAFRVFQNYGAAVYTEAFKALSEGIMTPTYDIFDNKMYELLDDELLSYIQVLEKPAGDEVMALGEYDPIYGYIASKTASAPAIQSKYDVQRTNWKKFANSYRLYMAWIMKAVDRTRFDKVLAETKASGWFESAADGAVAYMNGSNANSGLIYNSDGPNSISVTYAVSANFISYLKELDDPRLPLLARNNGLNGDNKAIQWMQHYFPDSLQKHAYYDKQTKTWLKDVLWGDVLDFATYPKMAYQGVSANPYNYDMSGPGNFWGQRNFTFRFHHPDYKPGDAEWNKKLKPWTVTNKGAISKDFPAQDTIWNADTTFTIEMGSRPQGRYFVADGGKKEGDGAGNSGVNGNDGPVNPSNKFYTHPVYTYPEFCFMMAYLTLDGVATGKTADVWYEEGVTEAMKELQTDAIRYEVQVATNSGATKIVGVNDAGVYSITDKIAPYVQAQALANAADKKEAIVGQMWIYAYNQPNKMWDWWRLTGYPKIVKVTTPADAAQVSGPYWVQPVPRTSTNVLSFPRRASLPQPNELNNANYNAARDALLGPVYGTTYNQTTGRIYWDVQGL